MNSYEYELIRVMDVYGRYYWISRRHYEMPERNLIPVCRADGLKREYTKAGEKDGMNMLHRANIARIVNVKRIYRNYKELEKSTSLTFPEG